MNVLHLYNVFGAPTERAWLNTALGVAAAGHAVTCAYETMHDEAVRVDLPLVQLPRVCVEPTSDPAAQMEKLAAGEPLVAGDFDVIHGHFGPRVLWAAPWIARGVPTVISLYGYDASRLLRDASWIGRYRWAAERGAMFAVLSEAMRKRMVSLGLPAARLRIVRLGIDLERWRYEEHAAPATARFVFVGRLTPKKRPQDAIRAAALMHGARLDVIGGGELERELRALIAELNVGDRVRLLGAMSGEAIQRELRGATALVLPSATAEDGDEEGTPVVLMEAQAMGVPCITTDHAGNGEVIPPKGRRFVVSERDVAALSEAMEAMASLKREERVRLQRAGRAWMEKRHDLREIVPGYLRLYDEMGAGSGRRGS